jgi:hypothetical protein
VLVANNFTGRTWKITQAGTTPFGTANVKFKGGSWSGMTAGGQTFTITDEAGRVYTWYSSGPNVQVTFQELGWLSGALTFGGTFTGEIDLYLGSK